MGKWARGKTEPTDKPTLLSGNIASGDSRTGLRWLPSALQHSILLILNPTLPSGPQDSSEQPSEASKRRSGRGSRQLTLSGRPRRRCLRSYTASRALVGVAALALGVGAWQPKVAKFEFKAGPQGHTAASRWALRGSAARVDCAERPGP